MEIKFIKTHPDAKLPTKNHPHPLTGDAGFDLFSVAEVSIPPRGSVIVPVGLTLGYVTPGWWFRIEGRSGLGFSKGVSPHQGIIDNGYRGDLGIKLYNASQFRVIIEKGKGVAQIIPYEMEECEVEFIDEIVHAERGEKGFGSSDKKND